MTQRTLSLTAALLAIGTAGGGLATLLHLPMPWMLGSLLSSALVVMVWGGQLDGYRFPQTFRGWFVALIGVMIGAQVTPALLGQIAVLPLTLTALVVFILVAHLGNYLIFTRLGGLDRPTAFYSGTTGGLMESILMGDAVGADIRVLTLQQFLRIILVIALIPSALSIWLGAPVGSAAGILPDSAQITAGAVDYTAIALLASIGLATAGWLHVPAAQIIGPLLLTAAVSLLARWTPAVPFWLIATAQVVVGVSLGMRFNGITGGLVRRSAGLALVSVGFMLALGAALSWWLHWATGLPFLHLLISFAPGGVTEMSVIALSLAASPALVSLHHVARILMTVAEMTLAARWLGLSPPAADGAERTGPTRR